ncbi:MAG: hypothetical protein HZY79_13630 [Rhodoblastus sp.]|nr:MAG: hypothetical protein HZY79_13630 [Rhodoblastus sp.]
MRIAVCSVLFVGCFLAMTGLASAQTAARRELAWDPAAQEADGIGRHGAGSYSSAAGWRGYGHAEPRRHPHAWRSHGAPRPQIVHALIGANRHAYDRDVIVTPAPVRYHDVDAPEFAIVPIDGMTPLRAAYAEPVRRIVHYNRPVFPDRLQASGAAYAQPGAYCGRGCVSAAY